jgi:hypothetical protein
MYAAKKWRRGCMGGAAGGCNGGEERGKGKEQNHKIREHITEVLEAA